MAYLERNKRVSALAEHMVDEKSFCGQTQLEWEMIFNTKGKTEKEPHRKVWGQGDFRKLYPRNRGGHCGATKRTHDKCHNGNPFKYMVVKVFDEDGWIAWGEGTGNQIIDEIRAWEKFSMTPEADFLCPVLKYYTCKSDKVTAVSEKMLEKCIIIAQKASDISNLHDACISAEMRNRKGGRIRYEKASDREARMIAFAKEQGWRDVRNNPGNCGVIFDYHDKCYKAVFIDYAL